MVNFTEIIEEQSVFFQTQKTKNIQFRKRQLEKLRELLENNDALLYEAIDKDFGKSSFETYSTEISFITKEINYFLKNLNSLSSASRVSTNLPNLPGSSRIYPEPLGNTLVIGAWNYPYQLSLLPAVAAMAAGNTVIIIPSEVAFHTMAAMAKIINTHFPREYLFVAEGGVDEITEILKLKFDKIFFTGSTAVGKIVYKAAAEHLTPVTLELGGKSPAVVTSSANLDVAAKRIVWGKFLNAGQTCVAPDYILVDEKIADSLLDSLKSYIEKFKYAADSDHYTRIINDKNFERLKSLIDCSKVFFGGKTDAATRFIEPTLLHKVSVSDKIMQEEIFGPLLPVLTFKNFNEALSLIGQFDKPLSAYLFTENSAEKMQFLEQISFGGGCINDVVMHLSNEHLPFGGVGSSGMGNYHGKFGFEAFSHFKPVLTRNTWGEPNLKYPPYTPQKIKWLKRLL